MNPESTVPSRLARVIAVVRIATGAIFFLFGEYKLASPDFAHTGFSQYLQGYIDSSAWRIYVPVLKFVAAHAVFFGYMVGVTEILIAASLILGLFVRPMSIVGALYMLNLIAATWWESGHGVPVWRYFGAELDHIPLLFLFSIFYAADAGQTWGLDRRKTARF